MAVDWRATLSRAWGSRGALSNLLLPVSWLYSVLTAVHRWTYCIGLRTVEDLPVPVIVVGNVIVGGAGKTPTVISLVAHLQSKGYRPGIISRGYGGAHTKPMPVTPGSKAIDVGDEPLLLQHKTGSPVVVGKDRVAAGRQLLQMYPDVTHIVCDDGMQHYRLFRELEICVFDSRGVGNKRLLPAGMLRQAWPRTAVHRAGQSPQRLLVLKTGPCNLPGHTATRTLAPFAINGFGETRPLESFKHSQQQLHAVAGIAQPHNFFSMLQEYGLLLHEAHALPDHYNFDSYSPNINEGYHLICTEKDAAKLWVHYPNAWAIPLLQALPESFVRELDAALSSSNTSQVSSRHGHKTH